MKNKLLFIIGLLTGILSAHSQNDVWSGDLEVQGVKIPLVFHLNEDNPTIDSPAQGAKGIPAQIIRPASDSIVVRIPTISAAFEGKYENDKISGKFSQRGLEFPLTLVQGTKTILRPQTPKPPYPYLEEEVSFSNGDALLKGTLTVPKDFTRDTPVVIMITGSGLQNRDEEIFYHKPFAVIADALARNGIASLRYDDRGFGESTGDVVNCTTEDLKNDALAGIQLLRNKFNKVGVVGHSEGGTIALMLGADHETDFLVSLAGMVVSGKELLLEQNRVMLSQAGFTKDVTDEYCRLLELAFDGEETLLSQLDASSLPTELTQNIRSGLPQLATPYMNYFLSLDLRGRLGNVTSPVLALNGTKDTQVACEKNLSALNSGLSSNDRNRIIALDGLNHLFQHCQTGSTNEYATIEETVSPEVLEIICQWIKDLYFIPSSTPAAP